MTPTPLLCRSRRRSLRLRRGPRCCLRRSPCRPLTAQALLRLLLLNLQLHSSAG